MAVRAGADEDVLVDDVNTFAVFLSDVSTGWPLFPEDGEMLSFSRCMAKFSPAKRHFYRLPAAGQQEVRIVVVVLVVV